MSQYFGMLYVLNDWTTIFYIILCVFLAFWAHGAVHAYTVKKYDCYPKNSDGKFSVNPLKYIDVFGFILMCVLGYGWCKTQPVSTKRLNKKQKIMLYLSGPIGNALLALATLLLQTILLVVALEESIQTNIVVDAVLNFLDMLVYANILMLVFHILPIPGFNGYNILKTLFFESYYNKKLAKLEANGKWIAVVLAITGLLYYCAELPTLYAYNGLVGAQEWFVDLVTGGLYTGSSWRSE